VQDPKLKGVDEAVAAGLFVEFDVLHMLSHHEPWYEKASLRKEDLQDFVDHREERHKQLQEATALDDWAELHWVQLTGNKNANLSTSVLENAIANATFSDADKKMCEQLLQPVKELTGPIKGSVSFTDLRIREGELARSDMAEENLQLIAKKVLEQKPVKLYGDSTDPLATITTAKITQSARDCFFVAPIISAARLRPSIINDMIKQNSDGSYTIKYHGESKPITVNNPTPAELVIYGQEQSSETWPLVLEKSLGRWRREHGNTAATDMDAADHGGSVELAMQWLTGKKPDTDQLLLTSKKTCARKMSEALNSGAPQMVLAVTPSDFFGDFTKDHFLRNHVVSVLAFAPKGEGDGLVTLQNPLSNEDNSTRGKITISLDEFMRNFSSVSYEPKS